MDRRSLWTQGIEFSYSNMSDTISVGGGKRSSDNQAAPAEKSDGPERPAKRSKRGRYVAKAW